MKIIVFGATGGTGKLVVEQSLRAGHEVTAVVRKPDAIAIRSERLEIIKGDALQPSTFEKSIRGKDAVISCLGVRKREPNNALFRGLEKHNQRHAKRICQSPDLPFCRGGHCSAKRIIVNEMDYEKYSAARVQA